MCYKDAVEVIRANREDMDKVVAYLLEKETITGGEMVAIIEGRDPALVEGAYTSTKTKAQLPEDVEPPARHIHMVDEPIPMPPPPEEEPGGQAGTDAPRPEDSQSPGDGKETPGQ